MAELSALVGLLTGLISVFTFVTGINTLELWRHLKASDQPTDQRQRKTLGRRLVWLLPLLAVSILVTLAMGLSGSDSGGIVSLLLLLCLVAVLAYRLLGLHQHLALHTYGLLCAMALAGLGWGFGSVSRGEELFGLMAGSAIGAGCWLITAQSQPSRWTQPPQPQTTTPADHQPMVPTEAADLERVVLGIASRQQGQIRVTDLTLQANIPLDHATRILQDLHQRGYCETNAAASGATIYRFPDLS